MDEHLMTLGERAFLRRLEELVKRDAEIIRGAKVATKRNAKGDLVLAVIIPAVRLPGE